MPGKRSLIGAGPHDRAREQVRAGRLALLGHGDRHLAELLGERRVLGQELPQAHGGREAGRAGADDQDAHVDPLVLGRAAA